MKTIFSKLCYAIALSVLLFSCKKETFTPTIATSTNAVLKTLILNEGNFGGTNGTLDIYDWKTNQYLSNVTASTAIGDVLNDIKVYGNKIFIAANNSNKVVVLDKNTYKVLQNINLKQPRFLETYQGKVYCTAYNHAYGESVSDYNGIVAVIDTSSLKVSKEIKVGRQPEGLAVLASKLYVANSGGYTENQLGYEDFISVINLTTLSAVSKIQVADNLFQVTAGKNGFLYVSALGNYSDIPANLFKIDINTEKVIHTYNLPVTKFDINQTQNILYYFNNDKTVNQIDLYFDVVKPFTSISGITKMPYNIYVQPDNGNIYLSETDYITDGNVFCFSKEGKLIWKNKAGKLPSAIAFIQ